MYQENFEKLELDDVARILDEINPKLDGIQFDPVETIIMAAKLPFYKGCNFLEISDHTAIPPRKRYAIYGLGRSVVLDFTNKPIYDMNADLPIKLTEENVSAYVRFFFSYVRGRHGRFIIAEGTDDISWKEEPPPSARQAIGRMIRPLIVKKTDPDGTFHLEARMVFKDSLFKSDISVKPDGLVTLSNEELLIEDMPVLDDTFGQ